jgi:hypothetical protein
MIKKLALIETLVDKLGDLLTDPMRCLSLEKIIFILEYILKGLASFERHHLVKDRIGWRGMIKHSISFNGMRRKIMQLQCTTTPH